MEQTKQVNVHHHKLTFVGKTTRGWCCNGINLQAGCKSNDNNALRWRCKASGVCDFDLCQPCIDFYEQQDKANPMNALKKAISVGVSEVLSQTKQEPLMYAYGLLRLNQAMAELTDTSDQSRLYQIVEGIKSEIGDQIVDHLVHHVTDAVVSAVPFAGAALKILKMATG